MESVQTEATEAIGAGAVIAVAGIAVATGAGEMAAIRAVRVDRRPVAHRRWPGMGQPGARYWVAN